MVRVITSMNFIIELQELIFACNYISVFNSGYGIKWDALCTSASISSVSCQRDGKKFNEKLKIQQLP